MHVYLMQHWCYSLISPETHKQICLEDWSRHVRVLGTLNFLLPMFQVNSCFRCRVSWHIFFLGSFHSPWKILVQYLKTAYFYISTKSPMWTISNLTDSRSYGTGAEVTTVLIPNKPSDRSVHLRPLQSIFLIFILFYPVSSTFSPK
jgi:hypothetical protein